MRPRTRLWSILGSLVLLALAIEMVVCVALYFSQDALILPARPITAGDADAIRRRYPGITEIRAQAQDGTRLQGWRMPGSAVGMGLIVYFGGQGGEVSGSVVDTARQTGWTAVGFNYRGSGLSQGRPSEAHLFADALVVHDYAERQHPRVLVAMGTSLGSGVAVYLASQRPTSGVVLVAPYDSITSVAQEQYPFVPVSLLIRHRFDSLTRAPGIHVPLLALAGENDTRIPPAHAQRLAAKWGGKVTLHIVAGGEHDYLGRRPDFWPTIEFFLHQRLIESRAAIPPAPWEAER